MRCFHFVYKLRDPFSVAEEGIHYLRDIHRNDGVTALKHLDHLTEFCSVLHAVNAVDIPQVMNTLFSDAEGIS